MHTKENCFILFASRCNCAAIGRIYTMRPNNKHAHVTYSFCLVSSRHSAVNLMNDGDLWAGGVGQRIVNGYRYWNAGRVESMSVGDVKQTRNWVIGSPGQLGLRVAGFQGHWVAGSQNVTHFHV